MMIRMVHRGIYGLAILDPFVYAPNLLGTFLGIIQVCLVLTMPRKLDDEHEKSEVDPEQPLPKDNEKPTER